jgi:clorobiocin biosynthesis protein Clo-hal
MKPDYDVIIIGGGPAGSTCATLIGRKGHKVLLLERAKFPRFHIGESITAFGTDVFKELGVYEELKKVNFVRKRGLEFVLQDHSKKLFFPSAARDEDGFLPWAFQMPRARLDQVLLDNARKNGADVREEHDVKRVLFEGERAVGVEFADCTGGRNGRETQRATARWVIDASGQIGQLNRQMPGNCRDHHVLQRKVSVFAHFKGNFDFKNGDDAIHFKLCVHPNGKDWAWWIPLDRNLCSLGVVLSRASLKDRKGVPKEELFNEFIAGTPFLSEWVKQPGMERVSKYYAAVDYSYFSRRYVGDGWALTGDSAGFIDPVFSTGLQITFNSARLLSRSLLQIFEDPSRQKELLDHYNRTVDRYYRVNGTLVHLFYMAGVDPFKFEDPLFMLKAIPFAGWKERMLFLYWGLRLTFKSVEDRRRMGEEVVFGDPKEGNLVAEQFLSLSRNFDKVYAKEIQETPEHTPMTVEV